MSADAIAVESWQDMNQRYLVAALARVRRALERYFSAAPSPDAGYAGPFPASSPPAALERLCSAFGLSPFECDLLVLCAGVELDSSFAALCAGPLGDSSRAAPSFGLALAALPEAHWSALTPSAPLRYWRLVEVGPGTTLTNSPLRIDERVLHYITGVNRIDQRLASLVDMVARPSTALCDSQRMRSDHIEALWRNAGERDAPSVQLIGADPDGQREVALAACTALGLDLHRVAVESLPTTSTDLDEMLRLWQRESVLTGSALLLDCSELDETDAQRLAAARRVIEALQTPLTVCARRPLPIASRPLVTIEVEAPTLSEQAMLWRQNLDGFATDEQVEALVSQFRLSSPMVASVAREAAASVQPLWDLCRARTRPRLESLAQRIDARACWDDLILPESQLRVLRDVVLHLRGRATVYGQWGFAGRYSRGLGISVLASGPSGTGKTMAAEVLANELRLDLYQIDLSQVVSKYIGETERNLARLFDAAEGGGAILLFDEADALFGKRSEVKDSHDRYANIEISYLLQRMEAFRGLTILTTNMKDALDPAFMRRIRFVVQFPFPDESQRTRIWRGVFPSATPLQDLDYERLARLNFAGGNIRNVAMNAAFLAAGEGSSVAMRHIAAAARAELVKLDRPINEAELSTWR